MPSILKPGRNHHGDFSGIAPLYQGKEVSIEISPTDLVDTAELSTGNLKFDLRYATDKNILHKKFYESQKCVLRRDAALGLVKASELAKMEEKPFSICVSDCYRPMSIQKEMWGMKPDDRVIKNPEQGSSHNRALGMDVYACDENGKALPMPTQIDDATKSALPKNVVKAGPNGRIYNSLVDVMKRGGFEQSETEWWHFDMPVNEIAPLLDFPVEE
jgi:D-alanyl-D-alanine dipeptidase